MPAGTTSVVQVVPASDVARTTGAEFIAAPVTKHVVAEGQAMPLRAATKGTVSDFHVAPELVVAKTTPLKGQSVAPTAKQTLTVGQAMPCRLMPEGMGWTDQLRPESAVASTFELCELGEFVARIA
jgi:hypothetical protein